MAHEITPWKQEDCAVEIPIKLLTDRPAHAEEINRLEGEGGGGNFGYHVVEAVGKMASLLAANELLYGTHYIWKRAGLDTITLDCAPHTHNRILNVLTKAGLHPKRASEL